MIRVGHQVQVLDRAETLSKTGAARFLGGIRFPDAGKLQPLSYSRGLARAAQKSGATIYGHSPVMALEPGPDGGWRVATPQGAVRAETAHDLVRILFQEGNHLAGVAARGAPARLSRLEDDRVHTLLRQMKCTRKGP